MDNLGPTITGKSHGNTSSLVVAVTAFPSRIEMLAAKWRRVSFKVKTRFPVKNNLQAIHTVQCTPVPTYHLRDKRLFFSGREPKSWAWKIVWNFVVRFFFPKIFPRLGEPGWPTVLLISKLQKIRIVMCTDVECKLYVCYIPYRDSIASIKVLGRERFVGRQATATNVFNCVSTCCNFWLESGFRWNKLRLTTTIYYKLYWRGAEGEGPLSCSLIEYDIFNTTVCCCTARYSKCGDFKR